MTWLTNPGPQRLPLLTGHMAKGPTIVGNQRDDVEYVKKPVLDELHFYAPAFWAEVGKVVSQVVQSFEWV